jgi:hypothetical protein
LSSNFLYRTTRKKLQQCLIRKRTSGLEKTYLLVRKIASLKKALSKMMKIDFCFYLSILPTLSAFSSNSRVNSFPTNMTDIKNRKKEFINDLKPHSCWQSLCTIANPHRNLNSQFYTVSRYTVFYIFNSAAIALTAFQANRDSLIIPWVRLKHG